MTMGLEQKWTDLSDMLATRTDDQLLKWKEVDENPRVDDYRSIITLRQLVVDLYNKSIKDIINELSIAVNDEINSRSKDMNMDKKLEQRISRLEKLTNEKFGYTAKESMKALDHCYDVISQVEQSFKRGVGIDSDLDEEHIINTISAIEGLLNLIKKYYLSSY